MSNNAPVPVEIKLKKASRILELRFSDGREAALTAEYLRVHSPSAEVTGHGSGEGILVSGKSGVAIAAIEPVGRYAVRLVFDDGHNTGLFTWPVLYRLASEHDSQWQRYLDRLQAAGATRESHTVVVPSAPPAPVLDDHRADEQE